MTIKEQRTYISYHLPKIEEDSWQYKFLIEFVDESDTLKDKVNSKIADVLWWLANSKYEWKANYFYPKYCWFVGKYLFD